MHKSPVGGAIGERLKDLCLAHSLILQELSSSLEEDGIDLGEATLHRAEKGTCMLRLDTARGVFDYVAAT